MEESRRRRKESYWKASPFLLFFLSSNLRTTDCPFSLQQKASRTVARHFPEQEWSQESPDKGTKIPFAQTTNKDLICIYGDNVTLQNVFDSWLCNVFYLRPFQEEHRKSMPLNFSLKLHGLKGTFYDLLRFYHWLCFCFISRLISKSQHSYFFNKNLREVLKKKWNICNCIF